MSISPIYVPPSGPEDASILIIGEAPGSDETRLRQPFVGESGKLLRDILNSNGINVADSSLCESIGPKVNGNYNVRFANLCNYQPLGSTTSKVNDFSTLEGSQQLRDGLAELRGYIDSACKTQTLKCIIVLGERPLNYICGRYGISRWRGSVVEGIQNIPTIICNHPAYVSRFRREYPVFHQDISKASRIYRNGYSRPDYNFTINPGGLELYEIAEEFRHETRIAVDIETIKNTNRILCIGFASSRKRAVCVVNRSDEGIDSGLREFCENVLTPETPDGSVREVIYHNGLYDVEIMNNNQIQSPITFDTQVAQHVLAPELEKKLSFITSIYTDIPYYKDKGKASTSEDEKGWGKLKQEDILNLYEYNCLDCVATFWCYEEMKKEIEEDEDYSHIFKYEMEEHSIAFHLIRNGLPWDVERRDQLKKIVEDKYVHNQRLLDAIVGKSINVNSPKQKKDLFYQIWNLPERTNKESKVSSDEDAIVSLISFTKDHLSGLHSEKAKYEWQKKLAGLMTVLKLVGYQKLLSSYINAEVDPATNRMRSVYKITGTETGRWSCAKYYNDTGLNAQTLPRESIEI